MTVLLLEEFPFAQVSRNGMYSVIFVPQSELAHKDVHVRLLPVVVPVDTLIRN